MAFGVRDLSVLQYQHNHHSRRGIAAWPSVPAQNFVVITNIPSYHPLRVWSRRHHVSIYYCFAYSVIPTTVYFLYILDAQLLMNIVHCEVQEVTRQILPIRSYIDQRRTSVHRQREGDRDCGTP